MVTDSLGCTVSDSTEVLDDVWGCEFYYFLPNVFSPDGNGENDILKVLGKGIVDLELVIYDRWGEKVFETTDQNIGWDGTYKGRELNTAVFVYYLKINAINGETIKEKGNITVMK